MAALATFIAVSALARPDYAPVSSDPHLDVIPRTPSERARIAKVVAPATQFTQAEPFEARPGGAATSFATVGPNAFSHPSANISAERRLNFFVGNGLFRKIWVSAPSSTIGSDGLGPLFSARACQRCHLKDGRGHPPNGPNDQPTSFVLKIAIPAARPALETAKAEISAFLAESDIATAPEPTYGGQVQHFSTAGVPAEARVVFVYEEFEVTLTGGEVVSLRRPTYQLTNLGYSQPAPDAMLSPRIAPQMIGLGLLETIPAADILAYADPDDVDGDGISGRPNIVWSIEHDRPMLGRFGHKAAMPTIREQSADAFFADMGLSTPLHTSGFGDCTEAQEACRSAPDGGSDVHGGYEVGAEAFDMTVFYSGNLAVPARRHFEDPEVLRGKEIFYETGCAKCHRPKFVTHRLRGRPEQSFQLIWPYTDMLLHDMGPGLADGFSEGVATGSEWRTPPLWGIGLTETVNAHTYFLHDGRARSLLEAILWHGGEAEAAKQIFAASPKADREALLRFLRSL